MEYKRRTYNILEQNERSKWNKTEQAGREHDMIWYDNIMM